MQLNQLKKLYEDGLRIFEANNLHYISDHIPTSDEPGFNQEHSWEQLIKQGVFPKQYSDWFRTLEAYFSNNRLNYARFKMNVVALDPKRHSKQPAAAFKRGLKEVERMISEPAYLESYIAVGNQPSEYREITFKAGLVTQGTQIHQFQDEASIKLLERLWQSREVRRPDGTTMHKGKLQIWGNTSPESLKAISDTINKSMRQKKISLRITYPRNAGGLLLVAEQL